VNEPLDSNIAARLRSRALRGATGLFAALFGVGSVLGVAQVRGGIEFGAFLAPFFVFVMTTSAWLLARADRERLARLVFVSTMFVYMTALMVGAPFELSVGLGFALAMLTMFLFHLTLQPHHAVRTGMGLLLVFTLGYATQALDDVGVLADWRVFTTGLSQVLVLGFSTLVLNRLARGWIEALAEADQARAQLTDAHQLAMQANHAKTGFLASMSHELRTPLNAVIGYAELVEEDLLDGSPPSLEDVRHIRGAGRHLLELVNQVLDLSRIEAGKLELDSQEGSLDALAREVCEILRPQLGQRHNRLELDLSPVPTVTLDRLRTRQILTNLFGNATKFTEGGRILVRVAERDGWLRTTIRDDGPGIPRHRLEDIFAPFEQATRDVHLTFGGTGLGLAISRRLAREMGGDLWAESELGQGATFVLIFPLGPKRGRASPRSLAREGIPDGAPPRRRIE